MENVLLSQFTAKLSKDKEDCEKADEYLKSVRSTPGLVQLLVKISLEVSHSKKLRVEAALCLSRLCENWKGCDSAYSIPQCDKDFLKRHILTYLHLSIPSDIGEIFEDIARTLAQAESPWDEMQSQMLAGLSDPNLIDVSLNMICLFFNDCLSTRNEEQERLFNLVTIFFPKILEIIKSLVLFTNIEWFNYVEKILDIYWTTCLNGLPPQQTDEAVMDEWLTCFRIILEHPMGDLEKFPDSEETKKMQEGQPQWRCKKLVTEIVLELFTKCLYEYKHCTRHLCVEQYFERTWAFEFFKVIIRQVFQVKEKFIPDSLLRDYLKYTSDSVESSFTFKLMDQSLISHLIVNVIMPILYREEIYVEHLFSLKSSAIFLLLELCKKGILVKLFKFIKKELQQSTDLVRKEASLLVLGSLSEQISRSSIKGHHIETMLTNFVLCEFTSQCDLERHGCGLDSLIFSLKIPTLKYWALKQCASC